ncbi:MAG TPA: hypothetical protein VM778_00100 [Gemmatimonadota bacterium]|nr:hypothetical protein [Gemmatimonadota bacterium]
MVVRRIGVLSLAKIMGAIYAGFGLIAGAIFALFSIFGAAIGAAAAESSEPLVGVLFGVGALIFMPLFYGLMGFVGGIFAAALYNLVAGSLGGLEFELAEVR